MKRKRLLFLGSAIIYLLFSYHAGLAEQRVHRFEKPLSLEEMGPYETIPFEKKNFEKVADGMPQESVLKLLGKPSKVLKQRRKSNRWTFSFFYPDGYRVNFRNGLVVGKEINK